MRLIHPLQITRSEKLNHGEHFFLRVSLLCVSYRIPVIETTVVMGTPNAIFIAFQKLSPLKAPSRAKVDLQYFYNLQ
jgi:hypothetical protein